MTETSAPADQSVPELQTPVQPTKQAARVGVGMLVGVAVTALLLGFVGGMASHALFPAKAGAVGPQGLVGQAGPAGRPGLAGPAGPAANIDTTKLGYCLNVTYSSSGSTSWVSGVSLQPPTIQSGTQSCPVGSFVPITATPGT
jgi:hypothetical protein